MSEHRSTNERLEKLEKSMNRIEIILNEIHEGTKKNNEIASELSNFIWILEKLGNLCSTIENKVHQPQFLRDEEGV